VASDSDLQAPLPAMRPDDGEGEEAADDEIAPIIAAGEDSAEGGDPYTVASLPPAVALDKAFPTSPEEIIPEAKAMDPTMTSYAATPRTALVNRLPGTDPTSAVKSGVKTTAKSARVSTKAAKREARAVVVAAQPQAARWAFDSSYGVQDTKLPTFGQNLARAAPSEVYTAGFQQGTAVADANRFTGKSVTFMTMARFRTN
jgi:hypothetical protein